MHLLRRYWPLLILTLFVATAALALYVPYAKLSRRVDQQLAAGPFVKTFNFYSMPERISVGDQVQIQDLAAALKRSGYRESAGTSSPQNRAYSVAGDTIVVAHGSANPAAVQIRLAKGAVSSITDVPSGRQIASYTLPPQLVTNISDEGREKRVFVKFADIPPVLVHAIVSAEDKRFFQHGGLDMFRIAKAVYVDAKDNRKEQGASTITMQLARNLWLDRGKRWKRKLTEMAIATHLERRLSKPQIFEYYCNLVYLGGRGTFSINGFGAAAHAFFNTDIRKLTVPQAALLAGLVQRPSFFNPFRYPERAQDRRNLVLKLMRENQYLTQAEYAAAVEAPLGLNPGVSDLSDTQYFVDLAGEELQKRLEDHEWRGVADVQTTLDLRLQSAAEDAVRDGMQRIDKLTRRGSKDGEKPQVALIALDPHTGEIKALVGGRSYSTSQLDRVLAKRPPGSVFKPFVYAAALNTALEPSPQYLTPSSTVLDAPTVFHYENQTYNPDNYEHVFHGQVTLRQALAKSMNVAAVRVAELTGYADVVALAKRAGMNEDIQPTPSVALGAYQVTPFEIAEAYTIFANRGLREQPRTIDAVRQRDGASIYEAESQPRRVLDQRVAFLMVDMLEEVMRSGTAANVRTLGFKLPAAGKTGTSHDGWFAGFTSNLLCVVWVGFDSYRELNLEGSRSALPIWTKFMVEASRFQEYRDVKTFTPPPGVTKAAVDPTTGKLATANCPWVVPSYFIDGTQPTAFCTLHNQAAEVTADGASSTPGPVTVLANASARP